ncbi:MAG: hypothetical protein ABIK28_07710 [Planctomycetota bacterium]
MEKGRCFQPDFLIVGEDRTICKRLGALLTRMEYRFQVSYAVHEAYEWLALGYFNIVLFDKPANALSMRKLLDHIYKRFPEIHIIAFIDMRDAPLSNTMLDSYSCDILRRSFDDAEFIKSVRHVVHRIALEMDFTRIKEEKSKLELQLQQALKLGALGSMAGGVIHDLNNMLGIIMANADLALAEMPQGSTACPRIEEAVEASMRAKEMLQRMLTYYRYRPRDQEIHTPAFRAQSP